MFLLNLSRNFVEDTTVATEFLTNLIIDSDRRDHVDLEGLTSQHKWVEIQVKSKSNTEGLQSQDTNPPPPQPRMRIPHNVATKLSQEPVTTTQ